MQIALIASAATLIGFFVGLETIAQYLERR